MHPPIRSAFLALTLLTACASDSVNSEGNAGEDVGNGDVSLADGGTSTGGADGGATGGDDGGGKSGTGGGDDGGDSSADDGGGNGADGNSADDNSGGGAASAECVGQVFTCRYADPTSGFDSCVDYYDDDGWTEEAVSAHCGETLAEGGDIAVVLDDSCFAAGLGAGDDPEGRCIVLGGDGEDQRAQLYGTPQAICTAFVGDWEDGLDPVCGGGDAGGEGDDCEGMSFAGFCIPDLGDLGGLLGGGGSGTEGNPEPGVVSCNPAGQDQVSCEVGQVCCFDGGLSASGYVCADSAEQCPEEAQDVQECDGPEDCADGEFCCSGSGGGICMSDLEECSGTNLVGCHTVEDCAEFAPEVSTCRLSLFGGTPWGICRD